MEQHWYEITLDGYFKDGQCLWNKVDLIYVPNVKFQETAFLVKENGGTLIVGDLLAGERQDQGIRDEELELCGAYNVADLDKARKSLWKLLDFDFKTLCFAHGTPVRKSPKEKLRSYLESQEEAVPHHFRSRLLPLLRRITPDIVERDPNRWHKYCTPPLWVAPLPDSTTADVLQADVQAHLDYQIEHQTPSGTWEPFWTWGNDYADAWEQAKQEWRGHLTLETLTSLQAFGRIAFP